MNDPTESRQAALLVKAVATANLSSHSIRSVFVETLAVRERHRDLYWRQRDPINESRLRWRAQTLRQTVHLLPGQTILELGCGEGRFTEALVKVSRGENPITRVTFQTPTDSAAGTGEPIIVQELPGPLRDLRFDCIVVMDLLDDRTSSDLLQIALELLLPGGEIICFESNPWNPVYRLRSFFSRLMGQPDPRSLLSRPRLYELASEIGFIRIYAIYSDFVFAPLTPSLIWFLRNASILLENAPGLSRMAGVILVHGQRPPRKKELPTKSLFQYESLRGTFSVVVPARNEEPNIRPLVAGILALYGEYIHEIILVNDGSTDGTASILDELARTDARIKPIHRKPPNGVGRALKEGLAAATGAYVLTMDCDFEHLLPELRDLIDAAAVGNDVVIGSRFSRDSVLLNYPFMKIVANRAFHWLARMVLFRNFRDVTNNLKLLRREVVDDLQLHEPGFAVNAETGLQPYLLGYRVQEVPLSWINRTPGMGSSSFRLVKVGGGYWRVLLELWLLRVFQKGRYRSLQRGAGAKTRAAPVILQ